MKHYYKFMACLGISVGTFAPFHNGDQFAKALLLFAGVWFAFAWLEKVFAR